MWLYNNKELKVIPEETLGFVYRIDFWDDSYYIGRKNFYSERRVKVVGKKNRRKVIKESNWKTYNTSSVIVKKRIADGETHTKTIIHMCANKACIMYWEVYEQMVNHVLCDPLALNGNVLMKIFHCGETIKGK